MSENFQSDARESQEVVKPKATLDLCTDLLIEILKGFKDGESPRAFQVVADALPPDAKVIGAKLVWMGQDVWSAPDANIRIVLESESFTDGQRLSPVLQTVELHTDHSNCICQIRPRDPEKHPDDMRLIGFMGPAIFESKKTNQRLYQR